MNAEKQGLVWQAIVPAGGFQAAFSALALWWGRQDCLPHWASQLAKAESGGLEASPWLDRMWGRMASGGRLVIGLCEFSSPLVARSAC
jgi:hypothetical protein